MNVLLKCLILDFRSSINRLYEVTSIVICSACLALIILVFLSLRNGLTEVVKSAGAESIVVVLGSGSASEVISSFTTSEVDSLTALVKAQHGADVVVSPELFTNIRAGNAMADEALVVAVRGVTDNAYQLRRNFNVYAGRMYEQGRRELVIGRELATRFDWLQLNKRIRLGALEWTIVGFFEADETVVASEIWGDASLLQDAYNRKGIFQSLRIGLPDSLSAHHLADRLNDNADGKAVLARTQRDYYASQINEMTAFIDVIAIPSIGILMLAAGFSALQSMHTMIEVRRRETAVLRAIGYPVKALSISIFSFVILLSVVGSILGCFAAYGVFSQAKAVIHNHLSLSEVVFPFTLTLSSLVIALCVSIAIAAIGGLPPAYATLRSSIVKSIRKA